MKNSKWCKILNHSKPWSYILLFTVVVLMIVYSYKIGQMTFDATFKESFETFWDWIDPVAGIMTFLTTLAIFWFQAKEKWKSSLEKLLTVDYILTNDNNDIHIARVENAYLAGESDIRQWAQSLGQQIMGFLDFDMNWDEDNDSGQVVFLQGEYFRSYKVTLFITADPRLVTDDPKKGKKVMEEFIARKFKHSTVEGDLNNLPITWKRN